MKGPVSTWTEALSEQVISITASAGRDMGYLWDLSYTELMLLMPERLTRVGIVWSQAGLESKEHYCPLLASFHSLWALHENYTLDYLSFSSFLV